MWPTSPQGLQALSVAALWITTAAGAVAVAAGWVSAVANNRASDITQSHADKRIAEAGAEAAKANAGLAQAQADTAKANALAADANERAALANERAAILESEAAKLRLELANVKVPLTERRLTQKQLISLVNELNGKKILAVLIAPSPDREINTYAKDFIKAFNESKNPFMVTFLAGAMQNQGVNVVPDGLNIAGDEGENRKRLETALKNAGISFGNAALPDGFIKVPSAAFIIIGFRPNLPTP